MTPALYLFHKPVGPTSFSLVKQCIDSARRSQPHRRPRICHGGTLDPFAHGLLIMLAGSATRLFDYLHAIPKTYEATVRWGVETDNGDLLGQPIMTGDASALSANQLDDALASFTGWQDQIPHATSNKRVGGERAYLKAHRGETVEMPPSRVYLHEAKWLGHEGFDGGGARQSWLRLVTRGGYYVRSLARDLGRLAGCGAHLSELHRTSIGPYIDPGPERQVEIHGRDLLPWAAGRLLSDQDVGDLRQGRTIPAVNLLPPDWPLPSGFPDAQAPIRGFHQGRLVFLLRVREGWLNAVAGMDGGI